MASIIDVSSSCTAKATALHAGGVSTVIRYYSRDTIRPSKRLARDEARALAVAGLRLGVVHEARRGDLPDSFEHAAGIADARYARSYGAATIGQPGGSAIYFAVDFDAGAAQLRGQVVPYFRGVADAFAETSGEPDYQIGVYGSGAVCAALLEAQLVRKTWLAQSRGWRGYDDFLASGRWNLQQAMPTTVAGVACDPDTAGESGDIGDFSPGSGSGVAVPMARRAEGRPVEASADVSVMPPTLRPMRVNARAGLRLRSGPGTEFDVLRLLPLGTPLFPVRDVGAWTQADLQGDGVADGYVSTGYLSDDASAIGRLTVEPGGHGSGDLVRVPELIRQGRSPEGLKAARITAKSALAGYPTNGCAAHLSALLQQAGIDVPMTLGAGRLAHVVADRGWARVAVGRQRPGDIGVCFDYDPSPTGADHIFLVIETSDPDTMLIADNQRRADALHARSATGRDARTPTEYFLRAS